MLKNALSDLPLACVVWDDAHGAAVGEYTMDEAKRDFHKPAPVKTFGLLMQDDETGVTLGSEDTSQPSEPAPTYRGLSFIPRPMIKEVIIIGVPKRPTPRVKRPQPTAPPGDL